MKVMYMTTRIILLILACILLVKGDRYGVFFALLFSGQNEIMAKLSDSDQEE